MIPFGDDQNRLWNETLILGSKMEPRWPQDGAQGPKLELQRPLKGPQRTKRLSNGTPMRQTRSPRAQNSMKWSPKAARPSKVKRLGVASCFHAHSCCAPAFLLQFARPSRPSARPSAIVLLHALRTHFKSPLRRHPDPKTTT